MRIVLLLVRPVVRNGNTGRKGQLAKMRQITRKQRDNKVMDENGYPMLTSHGIDSENELGLGIKNSRRLFQTHDTMES